LKERAKRSWEVVGEAEIFSPIELSLTSGIVHVIHVSSPNNRYPGKFTSQIIFHLGTKGDTSFQITALIKAFI
jgi:hypothetical protein